MKNATMIFTLLAFAVTGYSQSAGDYQSHLNGKAVDYNYYYGNTGDYYNYDAEMLSIRPDYYTPAEEEKKETYRPAKLKHAYYCKEYTDIKFKESELLEGYEEPK